MCKSLTILKLLKSKTNGNWIPDFNNNKMNTKRMERDKRNGGIYHFGSLWMGFIWYKSLLRNICATNINLFGRRPFFFALTCHHKFFSFSSDLSFLLFLSFYLSLSPQSVFSVSIYVLFIPSLILRYFSPSDAMVFPSVPSPSSVLSVYFKSLWMLKKYYIFENTKAFSNANRSWICCRTKKNSMRD